MTITVSLAQMEVAAAEPERNIAKARTLVAEAARRGSDLICFPEMWTTGFDWDFNKKEACRHEGVVSRVAAMARQFSIWLNGSMIALDESGSVSNTSVLFSPDGSMAGVYRKTHLFSPAHEDRHMAPGNCLTAVNAPWGRTGLSICYDLRFPELFRSYALKGVCVQLCPSAFPYPRLEHWRILVRARAIENQMFMIAVNQVGPARVGSDDGVTFFGSSVIIDPWGRTVIEADECSEMLLTATIDIEEVTRVRSAMTVFKDRRPEIYEL